MYTQFTYGLLVSTNIYNSIFTEVTYEIKSLICNDTIKGKYSMLIYPV